MVSDQLHFDRGERAPRTHWVGGCVGPRAGLYAVAEREILSLRSESKADRPAHNLITIMSELYRLFLSCSF